MSGPKPQPDAVRNQKRDIRSERKPRGSSPESIVLADGVHPPKWLKREGLQIWKRLAPTLQAAKLLSVADAQTFGRYCHNFARWLKLQQMVEAEGSTYETETYGADGTTGAKLKRTHPAMLIADRIERQLLAIEDRFGLNPAERQRIFAARAQGSAGDLFTGSAKRPNDPAAEPARPAQAAEEPEGYLN